MLDRLNLEDYWITSRGEKIAIEDMEDSHLVNTIKWLFRHAEDLQRAEELECMQALTFLQGDMAQFYVEQDFNMISSMPAGEWLIHKPIMRSLHEEAEYRNLDIARRLDVFYEM